MFFTSFSVSVLILAFSSDDVCPTTSKSIVFTLAFFGFFSSLVAGFSSPSLGLASGEAAPSALS